MTDKVKPVPDGYHTVTPYLTVQNAAEAIEFYKKAFGASEIYRLAEPGGRIGHAEIQIGDTKVMLSDEYPEMEVRSPQTLGGSAVGLHIYIEDVDSLFNRAIAAGAVVVRPVKDQFFGERSGKLVDPFGHFWFIATQIEEITPEEIKRRYAAMLKETAKV